MINFITVLNPQLTQVASIFNFISCIWTTQYFAPGDFELVVEYSEANIGVLSAGNFVVKNSTSEIAVIEKVRYNYTPEEGGTITASGRMAISLLDRRLICNWSNNAPQIITYCYNKQRVERAARNTVNTTAINPTAGGSARIIPGLVLGTLQNYTETSDKHVSTYQNLYTALTALLGSKQLGHRIVYDGAQKKLAYEVFKGTDRSSTLVFSRYLENLLSISYETDVAPLKTVAYIGGDGDGLQRFVTSTSINGGGSQLERRELFISASSNREQNESATSYAAVLATEARSTASEYAKLKTIEAEIDLVNSGLEFGVDYNVGDIILIKDIVNYKPRITTVIESQSSDGYTIDVEFNEDAPEEENE